MPRETAPSQMRQDEPRVARILGTVGLFLVVLVSAVMLVPTSGFASVIGPFWRTLLLSAGISCMLYHAVRDSDVQVRRMYGMLGFVLLASAALISALPIGEHRAGAQFLPWGLGFLGLGLLFLMAFMRAEDDRVWRTATLRLLLVVGAGLALAGLIGGNVSEKFLIPYGMLLALAGLAFLWSFVGIEGASSSLGYAAALGLGVVGALMFLIGLGRSILPGWFYEWNWINTRPEPYLVPSGLVLMGLGLFYLIISVGICSENRLMVQTRRELAAYFYSPLAYLVMLAFAFFAWIMFYLFVTLLEDRVLEREPIMEPVIRDYLVSIFPIMLLIILGVPILTMRLVSEEQRTGTLEVLLTAPVSEIGTVMSKFLAVFLFYMLLWVPWLLCLVALRVGTGLEFEYRPLLCLYIAVACFGAHFLAMGLFFSSLTRNQLIAAVLTAAVLLGMTILYWIKGSLGGKGGSSTWITILQHISYIDLYLVSARDGAVAPKYLLFHLSAAVFWLFLTVKVLESRKWR